MAKESLAHIKPLITEESQDATRVASRVERGRQLFEEHASEIQFLENDVWLVPSCTGETRYLVNVRLERCECKDWQFNGQRACKHVYAAQIANAKSRTCSCCSEKVLGRFTEEVTEDDELLSWFPGDVLCADCIRAGYWV